MQLRYRATTLHAMSGIFLALLCAQCFAALSLAAELWHFHRRVSKSTTYSDSRRSPTIEKSQIDSKKRYLNFSLLVPDNYQALNVLRELELLYHDAGLRILQPENGQESYYDE